jgi:hypothetical protein
VQDLNKEYRENGSDEYDLARSMLDGLLAVYLRMVQAERFYQDNEFRRPGEKLLPIMKNGVLRVG